MIRKIKGSGSVNNKGVHWVRKSTDKWKEARRILYGETTANPDRFKNGEKKEP
jgi:hypothetical protein